MTSSRTATPLLRVAGASDLAAALADALQGGRPVAPLPETEIERASVLAMLQPDRPVVESDAAVVVATSGSTGRPKGVVLSRAALAASASATHSRLGGPGDWVLALPGHYVAGVMVLVRALLAGTRVLRVPADLSGLAEALAGLSGRRYISLVPTQLVRACADPTASAALATLDAVLLGGAAADAGLLARARRLGIPVVTTYGMSETCGGCVYDGLPLDGVSVEVSPGSGRVSIGGPVLFSGYRQQPELTAAVRQGRRFRTSDRGRWQDGRLVVTGRVDDVVVSGGVNVDLAAVERAVTGWPDLRGAEVAVVGVPNREWGTEVVAVTDGAGSELALRSYLRQTLPAAAAPRRLVRLGALPRTASGKIDRQRLVAELTEPAEPEPDARQDGLTEMPKGGNDR